MIKFLLAFCALVCLKTHVYHYHFNEAAPRDLMSIDDPTRELFVKKMYCKFSCQKEFCFEGMKFWRMNCNKDEKPKYDHCVKTRCE